MFIYSLIPLSDCIWSVQQCTWCLVEENSVKTYRGQGVILADCLTTVYRNQLGVWCLHLNVRFGPHNAESVHLMCCLLILTAWSAMLRRNEATLGHSVPPCYLWLGGDVCYASGLKVTQLTLCLPLNCNLIAIRGQMIWEVPLLIYCCSVRLSLCLLQT